MESNIPLFLIGCIGARLLLVYLAKTVSPSYLTILGWLALFVSIGFFTLYFTGWRKTGPETLGKPIWWNHLRPLHGTLYAIFAWMAITSQNQSAWKVLLLDVAVGLIAFIHQHFL